MKILSKLPFKKSIIYLFPLFLVGSFVGFVIAMYIPSSNAVGTTVTPNADVTSTFAPQPTQEPTPVQTTQTNPTPQPTVLGTQTSSPQPTPQPSNTNPCK